MMSFVLSVGKVEALAHKSRAAGHDRDVVITNEKHARCPGDISHLCVADLHPNNVQSLCTE